MHNNEAFRRIRYALELDDATTLAVFEAGNYPCSQSDIDTFSRKENESSDDELLPDVPFSHFLNGLIVHRRGGTPPEVKDGDVMNNNKTLKKLRIALELYEDEMLSIFDHVGMKLSGHKLSALFRTEGHKHFRECNDHTLRQFLRGLALYYQRLNQAPE